VPLVTERKGGFIVTFSGVLFWPLDPRPEEILAEDVAHALANLCRYTGHVRSYYSVAEHSCYVSDHAPARDRLWGLLHDASEAYLGDLARPTKTAHAAFAHAYRLAEARLMAAVCERFGLPSEEPSSVARLDDRVLETEVLQLMPPIPGRKSWVGASPISDLQISCWAPRRAERQFLRRFQELTA
jgi:hypothetical protein